MEAASVSDKQIENDLMEDLRNVEQTSSSGAPVPAIPRPDFISDDMLALLLGYKNKYFVAVLAKGMGRAASEMLEALYKVTDDERRIYKSLLQDFIREYFPDWEDKISRISNASVASLLILELGRFHEAKTLIKADLDSRKGEAA